MELISKVTAGGVDGHRTESGEGWVGTNSMERGVCDTLLKIFEISTKNLMDPLTLAPIGQIGQIGQIGRTRLVAN